MRRRTTEEIVDQIVPRVSGIEVAHGVLRRELDELRKVVGVIENSHVELAAFVAVPETQFAARLESAHVALLKYGRHHVSCPQHLRRCISTDYCNCGFKDALNESRVSHE